jgi:hypothetical protein
MNRLSNRTPISKQEIDEQIETRSDARDPQENYKYCLNLDVAQAVKPYHPPLSGGALTGKSQSTFFRIQPGVIEGGPYDGALDCYVRVDRESQRLHFGRWIHGPILTIRNFCGYMILLADKGQWNTNYFFNAPLASLYWVVNNLSKNKDPFYKGADRPALSADKRPPEADRFVEYISKSGMVPGQKNYRIDSPRDDYWLQAVVFELAGQSFVVDDAGKGCLPIGLRGKTAVINVGRDTDKSAYTAIRMVAGETVIPINEIEDPSTDFVYGDIVSYEDHPDDVTYRKSKGKMLLPTGSKVSVAGEDGFKVTTGAVVELIPLAVYEASRRSANAMMAPKAEAQTVSGFAAMLHKSYRGPAGEWPADFSSPELQELAKRHIQPWSKVFKFARSDVQQVELAVQLLGDIDFLRYCWSNRPDLLELIKPGSDILTRYASLVRFDSMTGVGYPSYGRVIADQPAYQAPVVGNLSNTRMSNAAMMNELSAGLARADQAGVPVAPNQVVPPWMPGGAPEGNQVDQVSPAPAARFNPADILKAARGDAAVPQEAPETRQAPATKPQDPSPNQGFSKFTLPG